MTWEPALYDAVHSYVSDYGRSLVALLAPKIDERILDLLLHTGPDALRYLAKLGLHLTVVVEVQEKQPFNGPLTLKIGDHVHSVGRELAGHVFAERPP